MYLSTAKLNFNWRIVIFNKNSKKTIKSLF